MGIPQNLVEVARNVNPQAILLLDTNTILNNPRIPSYQVEAPGTFLLVIPQVVDNEILALTLGDRDTKTKQKATSALKATAEVYRRGNLEDGIKLHDSLWVVTVPSVRHSRDDRSIEDDQILRLLGKVDYALVRLAEACREDVPDIPVILVTRDGNLGRVARVRGLRACSLSDLRKSEILDALLVTDHPIQPLDLDTLLSPDEEQPVKVTLTLEELSSGDDYLIARGTGRFTWHSDSYPFRWTFPYKNAEKVKNLKDWVPDDVMPIENLDFFGRDEQLPEPMRRRVCTMLEEEAVYGRLQSPSVRAWIMFGIMVDNDWPNVGTLGEDIDTLDPESLAKLSSEQRKIVENIVQYDKHLRPLLDGTIDITGDSYIVAFKAFKAFAEQISEEPVNKDPMNELASLFDSALDAWSVGSTIDKETTELERAREIIKGVLNEECELNNDEAIED